MIAGEALLKLLEKYGVDTVFGIPGVHTLDVYRGFPSSSIKHISVRHEQGAGFAADGYARATGKPGVCLIISGPGVTNIATPIGQAWADSIPMLVISSDNPLSTQGKGYGLLHEVSDLAAVTAPMTAFSATAKTVDEIPELIGKAYESFATKRPRPVHIVIPTDLLAEEVDGEWEAVLAGETPEPDAELISQAADMLLEASNPLIMLGGGAMGAGESAQALSEWISAKVISTNNGKGVVPDGHPLNLGTIVSRPAGHEVMAAADVILAVGTEFAETDSYIEHYSINGKIIRVDIDPKQFEREYRTDLGILGDGPKAIQVLFSLVSARSQKGDFESVAEEVDQLKQRAHSELAEGEKLHQKLLVAIQAGFPNNGIGVSDMCGIGYTGTALWQAAGERQWHYPGGFCTLGCAMPMGIGVKLGKPDLPVLVMVGDAGFQFTATELATAYEQRLALPIIIWNNDGLGAIEGHMGERGIEQVAVEYGSSNPDFVALAKAYHCYAVKPESLEELTTAVEEALKADRPTIIEVWEGMDW